MSSNKQKSVREHKDYQEEVERLEFTKEFIKSVLEMSKGNKEEVHGFCGLLPRKI